MMNLDVYKRQIKGRGYFPVLLKRMATGNGDDIFMVDHDSLLTLSRQGCLKDLSGLPEIATYSRLALSQMREPDGAVYFLSLIHISSRDVFRKALPDARASINPVQMESLSLIHI